MLLQNKKLKVSKIGNIPIMLHRVMPKGRIKTLTIKKNKANQWFAAISCDVEIEKKNKNNNSIGIDVGIKNFAVLSSGTMIENPKYLVKSEDKLKTLQRNLGRKKKGSKNRRKAKYKLARMHEKISSQRNDFLHKLSTNIANNYSIIKVENLNIKNMVKNYYLAKSINDVSWNSFIQMLSYKAVACGGQFIKVEPRNTTKECSNCHNPQEMPLHIRIYKCNFTIDRDINAAINIFNGRAGLARTYRPAGDCVRLSERKAVINESETTFDSYQ